MLSVAALRFLPQTIILCLYPISPLRLITFFSIFSHVYSQSCEFYVILKMLPAAKVGAGRVCAEASM